MSKNGEKLRQLIESGNIELDEALVIWNTGHVVQLSTDAWFTCMIDSTEQSWKSCPGGVIFHIQLALRNILRSSVRHAPL